MQIGEVIRKYRKELGMTQEEMANRLGVTTPAVNKWENDNSKPDIELLAPIARLLHISLDTLLRYKEELTESEIAELVQKLDEKLEEGEYEEAFAWASSVISEYPSCYPLMWQFAVMLDARRILNGMPENEERDKKILLWYETVLEHGEGELRRQAADSLFGMMLRTGRYDEAETYLNYYSDHDPQKNLNKGRLLCARGNADEAYRIYEQELFYDYQRISGIFSMLYMLAMEAGKLDKAKYYLGKQSGLAGLFEMGKYQETSGWLEIYCKEQNVEKTLETVQILLSNLETLGGFRENRLYAHLEFKELNEKFYADLREKLLEGFRDKESFGFMEGDERWEKLICKDS